jgi:hypothetical protein
MYIDTKDWNVTLGCDPVYVIRYYYLLHCIVCFMHSVLWNFNRRFCQQSMKGLVIDSKFKHYKWAEASYSVWFNKPFLLICCVIYGHDILAMRMWMGLPSNKETWRLWTEDVRSISGWEHEALVEWWLLGVKWNLDLLHFRHIIFHIGCPRTDSRSLW